MTKHFTLALLVLGAGLLHGDRSRPGKPQEEVPRPSGTT